ncbi:MAG: hypothetical protein AAB610_02755 [Patescibacteria group bacterium]
MNTLSVLFTFVLVTIAISYGFGWMLGGPKKANWIVSWELKKLTQFMRWALGLIFQKLADLCKPPKKKKIP